MSLNKMGSKLARGLRQVKTQQDKQVPADAAQSKTLPETRATVAPEKLVSPPEKPLAARSTATTSPQKGAPSDGRLHPPRVWPD